MWAEICPSLTCSTFSCVTLEWQETAKNCTSSMAADIFVSGALHTSTITAHYCRHSIVLHTQNSSGTITYPSAHKCCGFKTRLQCVANGMPDLLLKPIATSAQKNSNNRSSMVSSCMLRNYSKHRHIYNYCKDTCTADIGHHRCILRRRKHVIKNTT